MKKVDFNEKDLETLRKCRNKAGAKFSDAELFKWAKDWETICNKLNRNRKVGLGLC